MSKKLTKIAEVLGKGMGFLEKMAEDFKATKISPTGARGMTIEQAESSNTETTIPVRREEPYDELNGSQLKEAFLTSSKSFLIYRKRK